MPTLRLLIIIDLPLTIAMTNGSSVQSSLSLILSFVKMKRS